MLLLGEGELCKQQEVARALNGRAMQRMEELKLWYQLLGTGCLCAARKRKVAECWQQQFKSRLAALTVGPHRLWGEGCVLGTEPKALHMLHKHTATALSTGV